MTKTPLIIVLAIIFISATELGFTQQVNYDLTIESYLANKTIEPTVVYNCDGRESFTLTDHQFSWEKLDKGIKIWIDGHLIETSKMITANPVWGHNVDSVNFADFLQQVKIYQYDSLIGFVLSRIPCSGLGCGVNYQIIYDIKSKQSTYFGRFRTGFEFQLYNFNDDDYPDYLSKTFYGRNQSGIDTTEFVMYSLTSEGKFIQYSTDEQKKYWFKHIYSEFQLDLNNEGFEENWIEPIDNSGR